MAFDEGLATRLREHLEDLSGVEERRMFGGLAFLVHGHMCCGINGTSLMLRLGKEGVREALEEPHTRPMDFTGRPLSTMVYVDPEGFEEDEDLAAWVGRAVAFVETLPPKN